MRKFVATFLITAFALGLSSTSLTYAESPGVRMEMLGKKKKYKGYKKPRSKKILGIFKRKSDCGCPNH